MSSPASPPPPNTVLVPPATIGGATTTTVTGQVQMQQPVDLVQPDEIPTVTTQLQQQQPGGPHPNATAILVQPSAIPINFVPTGVPNGAQQQFAGQGNPMAVNMQQSSPPGVYTTSPYSQLTHSMSSSNGVPDPNSAMSHWNLIVNYLPGDLTLEEFRAIFQEWGSIAHCRIVKDKNQQPKGYGFVQFELHEDAERAKREMEGFPLYGKRLKLSYAVSAPKPRSTTTGGSTSRSHHSLDQLLGNAPPPILPSTSPRQLNATNSTSMQRPAQPVHNQASVSLATFQ